MSSWWPLTSDLFGSHVSKCGRHERLYPKSYDDVLEILRQASANSTPIKTSGGSFPLAGSSKDDVVVDLRYINRVLGLDVHQKTVVVESGMRISKLYRVLETISLSLRAYGKVPDLTLCDALAAGLFGASADLMASLVSVQVALANGRIVTWNWDKDPHEMQALCCGLGMIAVVLSVTIQCVPLQRCSEISYLCSIRDVLETWSLQCKSSAFQQLQWFPFSELIVMTHISPAEKQKGAKQPLLSYVLETVSEVCGAALRLVSLATWRHIPLISSFLGRVQLFTHWSVARHRSDFLHGPLRTLPPTRSCGGIAWLLPLHNIPSLLYEVSVWAHSNPHACNFAPLFVQSMCMDEPRMGDCTPERHKAAVANSPPQPYLMPVVQNKNDRVCSVWYDWFLPESEPDPIVVANFEDIFLSKGGVRCWSSGRLTSPLVLKDSFAQYPKWCNVKAKVDPNYLLASAYVQGTVISSSKPKKPKATLKKKTTNVGREDDL